MPGKISREDLNTKISVIRAQVQAGQAAKPLALGNEAFAETPKQPLDSRVTSLLDAVESAIKMPKDEIEMRNNLINETLDNALDIADLYRQHLISGNHKPEKVTEMLSKVSALLKNITDRRKLTNDERIISALGIIGKCVAGLMIGLIGALLFCVPGIFVADKLFKQAWRNFKQVLSNFQEAFHGQSEAKEWKTLDEEIKKVDTALQPKKPPLLHVWVQTFLIC